MVIGFGAEKDTLTAQQVERIVAQSLKSLPLDGKRVLILIPDRTRTMPLGLFFRLLVEHLRQRAEWLTFMVALGTHPPLTEQQLLDLVGMETLTKDERFGNVSLVNHDWEDADRLACLGVVDARTMSSISGGLAQEEMPVRINRAVLENDHVLICGPVFPHEVAGFSGGSKYLFPGVSGPEVINLTHWVGALATSFHTIGRKRTPVRAAIRKAASLIPTPCHALCSVITPEAKVAGLFFGSPQEAWSEAADLSAIRHVKWHDHPYRTVFSEVSPHYDDLWTGAKGVYKVEPVVAEGGEVILYAPHIKEISHTHGETIDEVGYHVRDYFLSDWERWQDFPRGILAHSTHVRGLGTYEEGVEQPRIRVTLATGIPEQRCRKVNLGYRDPYAVDPREWRDREDEGILFVEQAGEILHRLKPEVRET